MLKIESWIERMNIDTQRIVTIILKCKGVNQYRIQ
jgi:hypothetical protein